MVNAAMAELPGADELDEICRLDASESEPESEPEDDEDLDEEDDDEGEMKPEGIPHP